MKEIEDVWEDEWRKRSSGDVVTFRR